MSVVYPYRKFVKMNPQTYQWDYKSIMLRRGCKLKLDWDLPVNTGASAESRGVAMSRISGTSPLPLHVCWCSADAGSIRRITSAKTC